MKVIKVELDISSIDKAISELETYKEKLNSKLKSLIDELVQGGVTVANVAVSSTRGDSTPGTISYNLDAENNIVSATIDFSGQDVLFIEFGAGIAYNTGEQHPKAAELGYGVGTYPSEHPPNRAINPGFWYYRKEDDPDRPYRSIGTEASMPLYKAAENIRNNLIMKAIEEFAR